MTKNYISELPPPEVGGLLARYVKGRHVVQIGIRDIIDIVLPLLNNHEYCQPEHIKRDGNPLYTYSESHLHFYENSIEKIAVRKSGSDKYAVMDLETYNDIKNGKL